MEEELKKLFVELVKFSKDISPEIWAILIKQQIVWGVVGLVGSAFSWLSLRFCYRKWVSTKEDCENFDTNPFGVAAMVAAIVTCIVTTLLFVEVLPRLINPAYYALMALKP